MPQETHRLRSNWSSSSFETRPTLPDMDWNDGSIKEFHIKCFSPTAPTIAPSSRRSTYNRVVSLPICVVARKYRRVAEPSGVRDLNVNDDGTRTARDDKSLRIDLTRDLRSVHRVDCVNELLVAIMIGSRRYCKLEARNVKLHFMHHWKISQAWAQFRLSFYWHYLDFK